MISILSTTSLPVKSSSNSYFINTLSQMRRSFWALNLVNTCFQNLIQKNPKSGVSSIFSRSVGAHDNNYFHKSESITMPCRTKTSVFEINWGIFTLWSHYGISKMNSRSTTLFQRKLWGDFYWTIAGRWDAWKRGLHFVV